MKLTKKHTIARSNYFICALYVTHISAIIGIYLGYLQWFLSKTWAILFFTFLILLDSLPQKSSKTFLCVLTIFFIGFLAEWLGVKYGFFFGDYSYGTNLGVKIDNVPLIIGINWVILSLAARGVIQKIFKLPTLKIIIASLLMVALDILLEPLAPKLGYWSFDLMVAPPSNYRGWFLLSILIQSILEFVNLRLHFKTSLHIFAIQFLFFWSLYVLFNPLVDLSIGK